MPGLAPSQFYVPRSQSAGWLSYSQNFTATLLQAGSTGIGTQVVTDNFNRVNEHPMTGNWTPTTTTTIRLWVDVNTVIPNSVTDDADAYYNAWASGDDQYSQAAITVTGTSAGSGMGVCVRHALAAATNTLYRVVVDASGNYELSKLVTGSFTSLRTGTVTYVAGNKLGLSVSGSSPATLKIWYNSVQVGADVTDSSSPITTGAPGLSYSSVITSASADNWDAGTTGGAPVTAFTKLPQKALSATGSFIGALGNRTVKALSATLSFVGNIATNLIHGGGTLFTQSLTATLSFVGFSARRFGFLRTSFTATLLQPGGGVTGVIDSYSESNKDASAAIFTGSNVKFGQCFTGNGSKILDSKWYLQKHSGPTGNAVSKIYAMTGTFGVNGNAGTLLATSDPVDVSTLGGFALITFPFSGANQYVTTNGAYYVVSVEYSGGDPSNYIEMGYDSSSATHPGTWAFDSGSGWTAADLGDDLCFYVDGVSSGTPTGALTRKVQKALAASLSFVGTFSKSFISGAGTLFTKAFNATLFQSVSVALTDAFNRANGALGSNWTSPVGSFGTGLTGAEGTLHIVSNQCATVTDDTHCYALWNGAFGDDQYAQIKVDQIGAWTGAVVRCTYGVDKFYFAFSFAANDYRLYQRWNGAYVSLTPETAVTWSAGDILRLEISGSTHPFSLRMYRNGSLVAQWTSPDSTYELTGGSPGMGIYSPAGLNLTLDDWEGGNYTPLHVSDSFNRADGALGANWSATVASQTTIVVSSNTAGVSAHDLHGAYFWSANAFTDNQYAQFRWLFTGTGYTGAILRADPVNDQYYLGLVNSNTSVTLYARWSGSYVSLATATPTLANGDMIRLEVLGSVHPITINMYQNGNLILSWTSPNSTNVRAGGSPGMGIYSPTGSTLVLDDWEGGNLAPIGGPAATLTKQTGKALSAVLSFIGTFAKSFISGGGHLFTQSYTATLSFTGAAVKLPRKALSATLTASASLIKRITRSLGATLSFTGTMVKAIRDAGFSATLSFVGNLTEVAVHFFSRAFSATLNFAGALTFSRVVQRALSATLAFSATLRGRTAKVFAATLSFSSAARKLIKKVLRGTLAFSAFFFKGGAVTVIAGWITKAFASINVSGSSAKATKAGSQLTVQKSSVITGSHLTVTRKQ